MESLCDDLFRRDGRPHVKYACADTCMGKSACVLPAVQHAQATRSKAPIRYVYVAFHNNDECHFKGLPNTISDSPFVAARQGAAFMVQCVKAALDPGSENVRTKVLKFEADPPSMSECIEDMVAVCESATSDGGVCVLHLDEMMRMCQGSDTTHTIPGSEHIRTGALRVLAQAANKHIVAPPLNETSLALNHGIARCARPWHGKSVSLHAGLVCQRLHVKAI